MADGTPPPFRLTSAEFATDPFLICADLYWRLRFLRLPSVRTAAECARWLYEQCDETDASGLPFRDEIEEKWALGYGFITRDSAESPAEITAACTDIVGSARIAYFATLYHAAKLRGNFQFDALHGFVESSLLAQAAGPHRSSPLFTSLRAFAAYGSRRLTAEHAADLLDHAWYAPHRTMHTVDLCLNALAAATPFDGQGPLLRDRAQEAAAEWPENHIFMYRLSHGLRLCGEYDPALEAVDLALALLPATGSRNSHQLLQDRYIGDRERILEGRAHAAEQGAHRARWARQEEKYREVETRLNSSTSHLITMITVFLAAIAFILSTVQLTYGGDLPLGDRMLLILGQGGVMLAFSALLIFGTHALLRYRQSPEGGGASGGRGAGSGRGDGSARGSSAGPHPGPGQR